MAAKPGPLLLMAGVGALLLAKKAKADKPSGNGTDPDYGNLPKPPGPTPEPGPVDIVPQGATLEPGAYTVGVGLEYVLPYPKGAAEDLTVFKEGGVATYGPNDDYVWEKGTQDDYMIIQLQKAGSYQFSIPTGNYDLTAVDIG